MLLREKDRLTYTKEKQDGFIKQMDNMYIEIQIETTYIERTR